METRLRTFEPVRGLVFGSWAEASSHVEMLLTVLAACGAERHWRGMRARSSDEARGTLAWMLRRRWALTALRENARLTLERLEFVGRGAAAAAQRRGTAAAVAAARARRQASWACSGLRARHRGARG